MSWCTAVPFPWAFRLQSCSTDAPKRDVQDTAPPLNPKWCTLCEWAAMDSGGNTPAARVFRKWRSVLAKSKR